MPKFSIIIPTFNSENQIESALESILNQTYQDFEVIIIDNLSTDATIDKINNFKDPRILIFREKDAGIYDAMNKGVRNANGDWLLFLGSDDQLYNNDTLTLVNKTITKNKDSKFIYGDVLTSDDKIKKYQNYTYRSLLNVCICHQSIYYHQALFDNLSYDTKLKVFGDWDFNLRVFTKKNNPQYIAQPLAIFNLNGVSNDWMKHPEYKAHFKNRKQTALKYRGVFYLFKYNLTSLIRKLKW